MQSVEPAPKIPRVAYLTGEYPRVTDTFIQREVAELRSLGVSVDTFSIRRPRDTTVTNTLQQAAADSTTYVLPTGIGQVVRHHFRALRNNPVRYAKAIRLAATTHRPGIKGVIYQAIYFAEAGVLAGLLVDRKVEHLHNHFEDSSCTVAMLASAISEVPYSFSMHGSSIFFAPHAWHLGTKIERASFVSCVSWFTRSQGALFANETAWPHMHVVHCGIDPSGYEPAVHTAENQRVVFVARLAPGKGVETLLDAVAQLADLHPLAVLDIVGDGPGRPAIETRVKALGLTSRVVIHGAKSPTEVATILHSAAVFVIASFAEGVPTVIMEAMGCALPVVATQVGGVTEIVHDGVNGYAVRPGDADAIAARLGQLLSDPTLRETFGNAGRALVEQEFCSKLEARRLVRLFGQNSNVPIRPELTKFES
jgi:colanic acid/amylovoran biosynthesis glycosyltransferase